MVAEYRCETDLASLLSRIVLDFRVDRCIVSSVAQFDAQADHFLRQQSFKILFLDENTPIPIINRYKTPHTLGKDRLAAVVGAFTLNPGRPSLVIDAGTAVTFDLITAAGEYLGGNISPGLTTRFRSLHHFTSRLPLLDEKGEELFFGNDTETAIRSGVLHGLVYEIEGYIARVKKEYADVSYFLTGGDANLLASRLKNVIFALPNLVMIGLNRIVEYNVENK